MDKICIIRIYKHASLLDTVLYSFVHLGLNSQFEIFTIAFHILVARKKERLVFGKVLGKRVKILEFAKFFYYCFI